jgi:hypothetical protein
MTFQKIFEKFVGYLFGVTIEGVFYFKEASQSV